MSNKELAIFGSGGHGKVCASVAEGLGYNVTFFDDAVPENSTCGRWHVRGNLEYLKSHYDEFDCAFVGIGNNQTRQRIFDILKTTGFKMINLVANTAVVDKSVCFGEGVLVVGNSCINVDSKIGDGSIINTNASIDHDCHIGRFAHICPNVALAGEVSVGTLSWVGIGCSVIQQVNVGSSVVLGAGSTVINDVPCKVTSVGSPSRIIKT